MIEGGYGSDLILGRGGDDLLVGDLGRPADVGSYFYGFADRIDGGAGNDVISGDLDSDVLTGGSGADTFVIDTYYGTDRITDFEDGVDTLALYGGLTITDWEARDSDGDGIADQAAALLSNGEAVLFDGYTAAPASLVSGVGLALHTAQFAIPDLADWSAASGWGGPAF
jgi:Ca2+-binding RTX toxin-like protein